MTKPAEVPAKELANLSIKDNGQAKNDSPAPKPDNPKLKEQFRAFSKFGDVKSDGKLISLSQSDKWMKQAGVFDKKVTTTDSGIHFKKLKSLKVGYSDYMKFLEDIAKTKSVELDEIKNKLAECGPPGANSKANVSVAKIVNLSIIWLKIQIMKSQNIFSICSLIKKRLIL